MQKLVDYLAVSCSIFHGSSLPNYKSGAAGVGIEGTWKERACVMAVCVYMFDT